ncbi:MAG: hydroxyacid dehydrogenase [Acidobacteria bacterium]|nr:hydroxyacid dehydrogenase [Acidobacteriota bacterium]
MQAATQARQRIVSTAPIDRVAIEILEKFAPVETSPAPDEDTVLGMLDGAVALVCRGEGKVTARMIAACPTLRVVGRTGVGYDSVDVAALTARRIPLVYAPVSGFAVAEGAMALLLALVKKILLCDSVVKAGQWNRRYEFQTGDMTGHTFGIVGLGRIGMHLARLARPFEMTILGYDPYVPPEAAREGGVEPVSLEELLARSDYVSLHLPLNPETRGLINRARIETMKPGAILVNTARGGVIESLDVLADALESGRLSAVGLDVFPAEPPDSSHRIFRHPNLLCAPHVVGTSEMAMERIYRSMATDMLAVLENRQPKFCVNPQVFG